MLRQTLLILLAVLPPALIPTNVARAAVHLLADSCSIEISGRIDINSLYQLRSAIQKQKSIKRCTELSKWMGFNGTIYLAGPGGDIEVAIEMGRLIRREQFSVDVSKPCISACVLVLLGGVYRNASVLGEIGLHRPFSVSPSESTDAAKKTYETLNSIVKNYLVEMNIPVRLLDVMNSVPPEKVRMLNPYVDEQLLRELFVVGEDPVFADIAATRTAKQLRISKAEYYARAQRAEAECYRTDQRGYHVVKEPAMCRAEIIAGKR